VTPIGRVAIDPDCCCGGGDIIYKLTPCVEMEPCGTATWCDGSDFPKYMTITVSGMSPASDGCWTGCLEQANGDPQPMEMLGVTNLNGTWRVSHSSACSHKWVGVHGGHGGGTTNNWCPGDDNYYANHALDFSDDVTFKIKVYDEDYYAVYAWQDDEDPDTGDPLYPWYHFYCLIDRDDLCADGVAVGESCYDCDYIGPRVAAFGFLQSGGTVSVHVGDIEDEDETGCPGGDVIYTDTDLSADVGGVVQLDDGVWYEVSEYTGDHDSDGPVTVVDRGDSCEDECL